MRVVGSKRRWGVENVADTWEPSGPRSSASAASRVRREAGMPSGLGGKGRGSEHVVCPWGILKGYMGRTLLVGPKMVATIS